MIRPDRWIKEKCMPPLATVSWQMTNPLDREQVLLGRITQKIFGDPFTKIEDAVKELLAKEPDHIPTSVLVHLPSDEEVENFKPMIEPFLPMQVREVDTGLIPTFEFKGGDNGEFTAEGWIPPLKKKIISKGLTSFGYDVTLADEAKIFTNLNGAMIDPLNFTEDTLTDVKAKDGYFVLPPNSYMLGYTREFFRMPKNVIAIALGKSTYARAGAIINVTPIEPGFEGQVVIEIANATSLPMKVYVDQGIAQFLFFESDSPCETSYADRNNGTGGKYQGQRGITLPKG